MESKQHSGVWDDEKPTTTDGDDAVSHKGDSTSSTSSIGQSLSYENKPGDILKNLQNVSYIYRQDVVKKKINDGVGIVTEVAGDTDSYTRMTDDEDDLKDDEAGFIKEGDNAAKDNENNNNNNYKPTPLSEGQVRILWMDGSETIEGSNNVEIVDRGFLHGDYVASAHDPTGQMGVVVDVSITVDLLTHDGSILKEKPSKGLRRIRDFTVGDHVVLGPWLGRIEDVYDNVTVQLDDGSVCKVMKADPLYLKPVGKNILEDGHFPYYPGQRVKATSSSVFKNSSWLSGLWKANRLEGTVTKVTVGLVYVYWIASAGYSSDTATTPTEEQSPKNLKLLSCLAHTNWQLGDWCLLPSSQDLSCTPLNKALLKLDFSNDSETGDESDSEVNTVPTKNSLQPSLSRNVDTSDNNGTAERSCNSSPPLHRKKIRKVVMRKDKKSRKKVKNFERALLIVNTHTKVDVAWQDGTIKRGLDSTTLIPIHSPGDHEYISEQYVVEKSVDSDDFVETRRVGVVKSVNAKDRTACVRWLKHVSRAEDPREFDKEEVVSVYELEEHLDYDYLYGDVVVRLSSVSFPEKMDSFVGSMKNLPLNSSDEHKNGSSLVHDEFAEFSDLSWVGNITGLKDGDIEVTWADGMISTVGPQAIYVVSRDDDESTAPGSDASDVASWETVEDADRVDNAEEHEMNNDNDILEEDSGKNGGPLSFPLSALGFMTRLASGIFYRGRQPSDGDDHQSNEPALDIDHDGGPSQIPNDSENHVSNLVSNCMEEEHEAAEASDLSEVAEALCKLKLSQSDASPIDDVISSFKGFDIVRDPIDHHFLGTHGQNNAARKWLKKVQHDWDILQNNLPEGVYVRVYEDRMDLLRAVIVGAYGTPYQDGLFFFDFQLPPEYPDVPPSAYYHSGGWRINPNLYEEGKVCLSLLNTWTGRGNEVWDPSTSTILQVLVSLQGLVLNSKPYFNEAGYDKQVGTAEGEKNSLSYNENTFLLNCKTMMLLMRKPPKEFEELVMEHFRKRGYYILKACDAYMKGHLIGSLKNDAAISDGNTDSNSVGFKLMLSKLAPKLFSSLKGAGSDCEEFEHLNQMQL